MTMTTDAAEHTVETRPWPPFAEDPWLVVIDMQVIFADRKSGWFTRGFDSIVPSVRQLIDAFGERVVYTRFIAPQHPEGAWRAYYEEWPFALNAEALNEMHPAFPTEGHTVVDRATFGKWGPELEAATDGCRELVLAGVSTDCCVLSTALAAADAGVHVRVPADATAGLSNIDHQRALDAMALYAPLIKITSVARVLYLLEANASA
jgi:nicotinamidase-related amidase